ncbi:hypothetical protein DFJ77DRAFT_548762 [Powellomyces hirtus]|nr:hypothetical protein DFJ77DRAFT_548762 [Powellomyces hirtus]
MSTKQKTFCKSTFPQPLPDDDEHDRPIPFYVVCAWESVDETFPSTSPAFQVDVTNGTTLWTRKVTLGDLRPLRPEDIAEDDYLSATQAALSGLRHFNTQRTQFTVTPSGDAFTADLSWHFILQEGIKFALGQLTLTAVSGHESKYTWIQWIDELIAERTSYITRAVELEERVKELRAQKDEILKEHEEWVSTKREAVDRTIYKKFKEVLNAKKAKIRNLVKANKLLAAEAMDAQLKLELRGSAPTNLPNEPASVQLPFLSSSLDPNSDRNDSNSPKPNHKRKRSNPLLDSSDPLDLDSTATTPRARPTHSTGLTAFNDYSTIANTISQHPVKLVHTSDSESDDGPPALMGALGLSHLTSVSSSIRPKRPKSAFNTSSRRSTPPSQSANETPNPGRLSKKASQLDPNTKTPRLTSHRSDDNSPESLLRSL